SDDENRGHSTSPRAPERALQNEAPGLPRRRQPERANWAGKGNRWRDDQKAEGIAHRRRAIPSVAGRRPELAPLRCGVGIPRPTAPRPTAPRPTGWAPAPGRRVAVLAV